ncbi:MAG: hypothetical protein AAFZ01_02075 [Pseudomonadota bacterium]
MITVILEDMSEYVESAPELTSLRPASQVMRLDRMGASFPTRLSFMRTLLRELHTNAWAIETHDQALDADGFGHIVITARGPQTTYSLVAFSHALDPEQRTDRVIANAWDATFTLFDGVPTPDDIERLRHVVPLQEAGRCSATELTLSRANKSVRLFAHVIDALSSGQQPDAAFVQSVGYLMRTTAVYGNGKFGIADREKYADRSELAAPFQAELLTVYLIRHVTHLLVEHVARMKDPEAFVPLSDDMKRFLGIGNSTGLGMAPFMHSHPILVHNWVNARETARARVLALEVATPETVTAFRRIFARARQMVSEWTVEDAIQMARIEQLRSELTALEPYISDNTTLFSASPWRALCQYVEDNYSLETQELVSALILEPHGDLIDDLAAHMSATHAGKLNPKQRVGECRQMIEQVYGWALETPLNTPDAEAQFWYVSEEKREPRLGERAEEDGAEKEMPLHVIRDVQNFYADLANAPDAQLLAEVLMRHPEHRHIARRIQIVAAYPYAEIRDNLVGRQMRAIDLLRFKLAFFGASKFDPKSDRWTRITMYQGAPLPHELARSDSDDWAFAVAPSAPN